MTRKIAGMLAGILFSMCALAFNTNANVVQLITNGGFETGLTEWTVTTSAGSGGSWFADTTTSTPLTGNPTVGPFAGTGYAVTDQFGPGTNALSQTYTVPEGTTSLALTFNMFVNDWNSVTGTANINALILDSGGNPVTGAGTLQTLVSTDLLVSGGDPNPYVLYSFPITGFVSGGMYLLDFMETDNVTSMNVGVDNVSLDATTVPEPCSLALLLGALVAATGVFNWRLLGAIRHSGKLLFVLGALVLASQPVHAQTPNLSHPVVHLASLEPGRMRPFAWIVEIVNPETVVHGPGQTNCGRGPGQNTCYYLPADINEAYTTSFISNGNGGLGITVAVVDAYFNSQTEADLNTFSATYGLPACTIFSGCLTIVGQTCGSPPPQPSPTTSTILGWFRETDLDLQWVHAIAPSAKILLVVANSDLTTDLLTAVQCAKTSADVVSNSYGSPEFSGETQFDSVFLSNVPILHGAGDTLGQTTWPCVNPDVTCIGGTHLLETATSHRNAESSWDETAFGGGGTGGGCSLYESAALFQTGFTPCGSQRGVPDVAADADAFTGVYVFLGDNASGGSPSFRIFGGNSVATPITAAIVALIDASRVAQGKAKLGGSATSFFLTPLLYEAAGDPYYHYRFYDVTTGTHAMPGWDKATGLGVTLNPALAFYLDSLP